MTYNDPQIVRSGECDSCSCTVRDSEADLYPHGRLMVCFSCLEDLEAEADEEARQEAGEALSGHDRDGWFNFAADVALAPFGGRV